MPIPSDLFIEQSQRNSALRAAVETYLVAVHNFETNLILASDEDRAVQREELKILHWRMDAEVLKLYALPAELEHKLLNYFAGCKRVGVPFDQDRYFPEDFDVPLSLADYLAITADWEVTNTRRLALIDRKFDGALTRDEKSELADLKRLARAKSALVMPLPICELAEQEADLRRRGLWRGA